MAASVITFIPSGGNQSESAIKEQLNKAKKLVTEGRYLITVFEAPNDWESHLPIEAFVISETLGGIHDRSTDWEFFGNGVIRTYTSKALRLSKAYQWTIVRRSGDKPYARRGSLSAATLKRNTIPVADKVFTRDVANNVWHLNESTLIKTSLHRFRALLTWPDEQLIHFHNLQKKTNISYLKMDLSQDLIGVAKKTIYYWDSLDTLF